MSAQPTEKKRKVTEDTTYTCLEDEYDVEKLERQLAKARSAKDEQEKYMIQEMWQHMMDAESLLRRAEIEFFVGAKIKSVEPSRGWRDRVGSSLHFGGTVERFHVSLEWQNRDYLYTFEMGRDCGNRHRLRLMKDGRTQGCIVFNAKLETVNDERIAKYTIDGSPSDKNFARVWPFSKALLNEVLKDGEPAINVIGTFLVDRFWHIGMLYDAAYAIVFPNRTAPVLGE